MSERPDKIARLITVIGVWVNDMQTLNHDVLWIALPVLVLAWVVTLPVAGGIAALTTVLIRPLL